jgi:hypothetical protein
MVQADGKLSLQVLQDPKSRMVAQQGACETVGRRLRTFAMQWCGCAVGLDSPFCVTSNPLAIWAFGFDGVSDALRFALCAQYALLYETWEPSILKIFPPAIRGADGRNLFFGPRITMVVHSLEDASTEGCSVGCSSNALSTLPSSFTGTLLHCSLPGMPTPAKPSHVAEAPEGSPKVCKAPESYVDMRVAPSALSSLLPQRDSAAAVQGTDGKDPSDKVNAEFLTHADDKLVGTPSKVVLGRPVVDSSESAVISANPTTILPRYSERGAFGNADKDHCSNSDSALLRNSSNMLLGISHEELLASTEEPLAISDKDALVNSEAKILINLKNALLSNPCKMPLERLNTEFLGSSLKDASSSTLHKPTAHSTDPPNPMLRTAESLAASAGGSLSLRNLDPCGSRMCSHSDASGSSVTLLALGSLPIYDLCADSSIHHHCVNSSSFPMPITAADSDTADSHQDRNPWSPLSTMNRSTLRVHRDSPDVFGISLNTATPSVLCEEAAHGCSSNSKDIYAAERYEKLSTRPLASEQQSVTAQNRNAASSLFSSCQRRARSVDRASVALASNEQQTPITLAPLQRAIPAQTAQEYNSLSQSENANASPTLLSPFLQCAIPDACVWRLPTSACVHTCTPLTTLSLLNKEDEGSMQCTPIPACASSTDRIKGGGNASAVPEIHTTGSTKGADVGHARATPEVQGAPSQDSLNLHTGFCKPLGAGDNMSHVVGKNINQPTGLHVSTCNPKALGQAPRTLVCSSLVSGRCSRSEKLYHDNGHGRKHLGSVGPAARTSTNAVHPLDKRHRRFRSARTGAPRKSEATQRAREHLLGIGDGKTGLQGPQGPDHNAHSTSSRTSRLSIVWQYTDQSLPHHGVCECSVQPLAKEGPLTSSANDVPTGQVTGCSNADLNGAPRHLWNTDPSGALGPWKSTAHAPDRAIEVFSVKAEASSHGGPQGCSSTFPAAMQPVDTPNRDPFQACAGTAHTGHQFSCNELGAFQDSQVPEQGLCTSLQERTLSLTTLEHQHVAAHEAPAVQAEVVPCAAVGKHCTEAPSTFQPLCDIIHSASTPGFAYEMHSIAHAQKSTCQDFMQYRPAQLCSSLRQPPGCQLVLPQMSTGDQGNEGNPAFSQGLVCLFTRIGMPFHKDWY